MRIFLFSDDPHTVKAFCEVLQTKLLLPLCQPALWQEQPGMPSTTKCIHGDQSGTKRQRHDQCAEMCCLDVPKGVAEVVTCTQMASVSATVVILTA